MKEVSRMILRCLSYTRTDGGVIAGSEVRNEILADGRRDSELNFVAVNFEMPASLKNVY